jgi:hypothetical protein
MVLSLSITIYLLEESSNAVAAIINLLFVVTAAERTPRLAAIVRASLSHSIISVLAVRHRTVQKIAYHGVRRYSTENTCQTRVYMRDQ